MIKGEAESQAGFRNEGVFLVLMNGSALGVNWAREHVPAIVEAWYPGQAGGTALADVLFGDYNPAGRLPVTFYQSVGQLPPFEDYSMKGRTYRFFEGEPLFPFGYGLCYTRFAYRNLTLPGEVRAGDPVRITVEVENAGEVAGEEVVQLYVAATDRGATRPIRSLAGFERIALRPKEKRTVHFMLAPQQLAVVGANGRRIAEPGRFDITARRRERSQGQDADERDKIQTWTLHGGDSFPVGYETVSLAWGLRPASGPAS